MRAAFGIGAVIAGATLIFQFISGNVSLVEAAIIVLIGFTLTEMEHME